MSHITVLEIANITEQAFGLSNGDLRKTCDRSCLARAIVVHLAQKHTMANATVIAPFVGIRDYELARRVFAVYAEQLSAVLAQTPSLHALIEGVERRIDAIHEARISRDDDDISAALVELTRKRKAKPLSRILEMTHSPAWYQENDMRFRRALIDAAE